MSTSNNKNDFNWAAWIAIVVLFAVGLWPISLILLIRQLTGAAKKKKATARARHPYDIQREQQAQQAAAAPQAAPPKPAGKTAARTTRKKSAAKAGPKLPSGKGLTIAGGIVTGVFGFSFLMQFLDALSWGGLEYYVYELGTLLGFVCLGLVLLFCGLGKARKGRRYRKYLNLIGKRTSVPLASLVKTTGTTRRRVLDDLENMLDDGLLPTGFLDLSRDLLVLSEEGIPDEEPEPEPQPQPEPVQDDNAILTEIRAVNDAIPDPVMSAKIDRIEEITGKILEYQRQNPGKAGQLRSFLNYYLPTTLKILRSYAQLDSQGVEGENISAAKARIEGMMDKVVEGFESQLDKLFADSAMDISSDVAVLERMLEKDGLSNTGQGMTLGG